MIVLKAFIFAALILMLSPLIGFFLVIELCKHAHHLAGEAYITFYEWL